MPSGKRSKEDTWTERDLKKAIQGDTKERKHKSTREKSTREKEDSKYDEDHERKKKERRSREKSEKESSSKHRSDNEKSEKVSSSKHRSDGNPDKESRHKVDKKNHDVVDEKKSHSDGRRKEKHRVKEGRSEKHGDVDKENKKTKTNIENSSDLREKGDRKSDREEEHKSREKGECRKDKEHTEKKGEGEMKGDRKHKENDKDHKNHKDREGSGKNRDGSVRHRDGSGKQRDGSGKHRGGSGKQQDGSGKHRDGSGKQKDRSDVRRKDSGHESDNDKHEEEKRNKEKKREEELLKALSQQESSKELAEGTTNDGEVDDYNYDDEDFDDYDDDDFEDDDAGADEKYHDDDDDDDESTSSTGYTNISPQESMLTLSKSEQLGVNEPSTEVEKAEKVMNSPSLPKKTFGKINFVAASQKQISEKTAKKTKKRGHELLQLIQLDVRSIDLFSMPPMTEYELYMKRFGQSDSIQTFTQTNDDNLTQEIQTEEIDTESRWCQFTHDIKACGSDSNKSASDASTSIGSLLTTNSVRLNKFLVRASQVCISLLEELEAGIEQPQKQYTESRSAFSDGYVTLSSSEFLVLGRDFCDLAYSPSQTNMLLTAYGASNVVRKGQKSPKGLICVWNTNEPTKPLKMLTCESIPNSCCFSSGKSSLAFAGMEDGVIAVWDLRELASYHDTMMVGNTAQVFRTATYTTAASSDNHSFPVIAVSPISFSTSCRSFLQYEGDLDLSFQLASLDQSGTLHIWIVVEVEADLTSDLSRIHDDLGLSPRGQVKLVKSGTISPPHSSASTFGHFFSVTCLQVDPVKPNNLYTGTDQGEILHYIRFGNKPIPKALMPKGGSNKVNAIDASPWKMSFLLACYDDGCVCLFHLKKENPLTSWSMFSKGESILNVKWSRSKPNVFFAIDAQSVLYSWDLLESDSGPVSEHKVKRKDKRAIGFDFANDYTSLGVGTPGRAAEMALIYGDGSVEIHRLSKNVSRMTGDELDQTQQYLDEIT